MSLQNNRRYWGSSIFWKQLPTLYTKPWRTSWPHRVYSDILVRRVFLSGLVTIYCGHCMPSSLLSRATETDALIVCINGVVLAMNLMLLPLTLQVASSSTSIFLAMLLLEFELFFFRSCQHCHWMDIMSHLGFIVPLIMISSTVQGFQKAAEQKIARKGWLHALTAIFVTSGCALFAYTMLSLFIQQGECVAIVGDVATCAYTRMYWSQGFLAPT